MKRGMMWVPQVSRVRDLSLGEPEKATQVWKIANLGHPPTVTN